MVEIEPDASRTVPLTLIPPVIAHSGATISIPEYSAVRETTRLPVVVRGDYGLGRIVYFANEAEALFYRYGFPDLGRVLANAVRWSANELPVLEVAAPDFVDVTLMAQPERELVHLVNFPVGKPVNTGWRHIGRNLVRVTDIRIRLKIGESKRVREVLLATTEEAIAFHERDGYAEAVVPSLNDHEIVVFGTSSGGES